MKKNILTLLMVITIIGVNAQNGKSANKVSKSVAKTEKVANGRANQLKKDLGLNDDQTSRVKAAVAKKNDGFNALKARYKDSSNKKGMGKELKQVQDVFHSEMNSILTPSQQAKYDGMRNKDNDKEADNEKKGHKVKKDVDDDDDDEDGDKDKKDKTAPKEKVKGKKSR